MPLGIMLLWCRYVLWLLFTEGFWGHHSTVEETIELGILACRHDLHQWYKKKHRENPAELLTRVTRFNKKIVGDQAERKLKIKGAQCWSFFSFFVGSCPSSLYTLLCSRSSSLQGRRRASTTGAILGHVRT